MNYEGLCSLCLPKGRGITRTPAQRRNAPCDGWHTIDPVVFYGKAKWQQIAELFSDGSASESKNVRLH